MRSDLHEGVSIMWRLGETLLPNVRDNGMRVRIPPVPLAGCRSGKFRSARMEAPLARSLGGFYFQ